MKRLLVLLIICFSLFCVRDRTPVYSTDTNLQNALDYAEAWALGRNTSMYKSFNADCANFVSQCLFAGGKEKNSSWYMNKHWYGFTYSDNWTVAHNLAVYAANNSNWLYGGTYNGIAQYISSYAALSYNPSIHSGDIILYNWADGGYHITFVTKSNYINGTLMSQHTTDRKDISYLYTSILTSHEQAETLMEYIPLAY